MRLIAGTAGGRRLSVPAGDRIRPTSDRVREALFSALESARGGWPGARVLDLYAGSGALGLEALSRGADHVELVEQSRAVLAVLRRNVDTVGLPGARVVPARVERHVAVPPPDPFDVVLADPPYSVQAATVRHVLDALVANRWLHDDALVVVERAARAGPVEWPVGLRVGWDRRYGDTMLWYGRRSHDPQGAT